MDQKDEAQDEDLETIQRGIEEEAAKKIAHTRKFDRQKEVKKAPTEVTAREGGSGEEFQTDREQGAHETGQSELSMQ